MKVGLIGAGFISQFHVRALESPAERPPVVAPVASAPTAGRGTPVLDPTLLHARRRKHSHHLIYRTAQAGIALSLLASLASLLCLSLQDSLAGQITGGVALASGLTATVVAGARLQLTERIRGYAVAATVLAALSLAGNILVYHFYADRPAQEHAVEG